MDNQPFERLVLTGQTEQSYSLEKDAISTGRHSGNDIDLSGGRVCG